MDAHGNEYSTKINIKTYARKMLSSTFEWSIYKNDNETNCTTYAHKNNMPEIKLSNGNRKSAVEKKKQRKQRTQFVWPQVKMFSHQEMN